MTSYDTLVIKDGVIEGELADGRVVTIPDKAWTDIDENTLEGNWEQVTRAIVEDIIGSNSLKTTFQSGETLSVEHGRFVDVLTNSSIVEHEDTETERQRAELLLEHLVRGGVYKRRGKEIVVLEEPDVSSDKFTKLNWTAFLSHARQEISSVIQSTESQKKATVEIDEDDLPTEMSNWQTVEQLAIEIRRMKRILSYVTEIEQQLREVTARHDDQEIAQKFQYLVDILLEEKIYKQKECKCMEISKERSDNGGIHLSGDVETEDNSIEWKDHILKQQENIQTIKEIENSILESNINKPRADEIAESIKKFAEQESIDLTGGVETADDPVKEADRVESESRQVTEVTGISDKGSDPQEES